MHRSQRTYREIRSRHNRRILTALSQCCSFLLALVSGEGENKRASQGFSVWTHTSGLNFESWEREQWKQEHQENKTGAKATYPDTH